MLSSTMVPLQKQCLEEEIVRLQRQLEMMETEYKLVDKTRVKALQVFKYMYTHLSTLSYINKSTAISMAVH